MSGPYMYRLAAVEQRVLKLETRFATTSRRRRRAH